MIIFFIKRTGKNVKLLLSERPKTKIMKVAVIDSSEEIGRAICERLGLETDFLIKHYQVGDIENFLDKFRSDLPDVLVLDVDLPHLAGHEIISDIMSHYPIPIIITCYPTQKGKLGVVQAMELGAIDFVTKPSSYFPSYLDTFVPKLIEKIKLAEKVNIDIMKRALDGEIKFYLPKSKREFKKKAIVIGVDNAAIEVFRRLVSVVPKNFPTILAVLDIPAGYTKIFADRLNETSQLEVKEANEKDILTPGTVLIAPGDFHMKLNKITDEPFIELSLSEKVNNKRPSVDVLMMSVAEILKDDAIGILASGYGEDGIVGLKSMKMSGADTIIINPETAILSERLEKAEDFSSHTHKVDFADFPSLLVRLI